MKMRYNNKRKKLETNVYYTKNNGQKGSRIIRADSPQELEIAVAEFKKRLSTQNISSEKLSLEGWFNFYIENLTSKNKESTIHKKKRFFNLYIPKYLKETSLNKITTEQLQIVYTEMQKKGYSENTIAGIHQDIGVLLNSAVKLGKLKSNPNKLTVIKGYKNGKKVFIDIEQMNYLLKHIENKECYLELLFLYTTGVRRGELLGLKWDKIDPSTKTVRLSTQITSAGDKIYVDVPLKTKGSERIIKIPDFVFEKLMKRRGTSHSEYVFTHKGRHWNPNEFTAAVYRIMKKFGFDGISPKQFRNSFVKAAIKDNISLKIIQQALGHSKFSTTADIYGELTNEDAFCIAEVFDKSASELS
nr:MAG TPA_asm: Integrase [Caudoviricetes sp.]